MKLILKKDKFLQALQTVQNIIGSRSTLPVLSHCLIQAQNGKVVLTTTNLDTSMRTEVEAGVEKAGAVALPAKRLFSIMRELPVEEIVLEVDSKHHATIRAGSSYFRIMGLPQEDFPPLPKTEADTTFKVDQKVLKEMFRCTAYSVSADESRFPLDCILLSFKDSKLTVVATDGRRLALVDQELEFPKASEKEVILMSQVVNELQRILTDEGEVVIHRGERHITFQVGVTLLISKLVEAEYPNYKKVIPGETKERVTIERDVLLNAVRRASLLSNDKSSSIKLHFAKNNLDITANTPDVGESKESLAINYKGKEFSIAFNPEYFADPLKNLDVDVINLDFIDELSPVVFRCNKPFLYILMPMRTA